MAGWCSAVDVSPEYLLDYCWGRPAEATIQHVLPAINDADLAVEAQRFNDLQHSHLEPVSAAEGARELVSRLNDNDIPWAVVTSSTRLVANARLVRAELDVANLITSEDVHVGKPDPTCYLVAAQKLGAHPSQCLVIEDADSGIEAARRGGMTSAGLRGIGGDIPIETLLDLLPLLV